MRERATGAPAIGPDRAQRDETERNEAHQSVCVCVCASTAIYTASPFISPSRYRRQDGWKDGSSSCSVCIIRVGFRKETREYSIYIYVEEKRRYIYSIHPLWSSLWGARRTRTILYVGREYKRGDIDNLTVYCGLYSLVSPLLFSSTFTGSRANSLHQTLRRVRFYFYYYSTRENSFRRWGILYKCLLLTAEKNFTAYWISLYRKLYPYILHNSKSRAYIIQNSCIYKSGGALVCG